MCSRAYDRAAIKFRGIDADINFNLSDYDEDLRQVGQCTCLCKNSTYVVLGSILICFY